MKSRWYVAAWRLGLALVFVAGADLSAQNRPDFTGTWIQATPSLPSGASHTMRVDHGASEFRVQIDKSGPAGRTTLFSYKDEHTYIIGASAESRKGSEGRVRSVAVEWEGETLVFLRTTREGANLTTEREVWSLSADGTQLTPSRHITTWQGTSTEQITFQKR